MLGTVLDGIPESMVIGLTIYQGGAVGAAYLAAVFMSNLPEAIASTSGLVASGWARARILWMWAGIVAVSGVASLAGYQLFQGSSPNTVAFVLAFAAGAILTMLADTMMPEAFEHGGALAWGHDDPRVRGRLHDPLRELTRWPRPTSGPVGRISRDGSGPGRSRGPWQVWPYVDRDVRPVLPRPLH